MPRPPRLGDILVQAGLIDELQLETALAEQQKWGNRLGVTLVKLGMIDEQELVHALSRKLGAPAVRLHGKRIDPAVLALVPRDLAERHTCLPLFTKHEAGVEVIYIGMEDPGDLNALDELSFRTGMKVRAVMVAPTELWETLERSYGPRPSASPSDRAPDPGDTEPHLGVVRAEPADRDDLLPRSSGTVAATPIGRLRPVPEPAAAPAAVTEASPAEPAAAPAQEAPPAPAPEPPDERSTGSRVPTRTILRALTQLLLEKEIVGRDELRARIQAVADRED